MHLLSDFILTHQILHGRPGSSKNLLWLVLSPPVCMGGEQASDIVLVSRDQQACSKEGIAMRLTVCFVLFELSWVFVAKDERDATAPRTDGVASMNEDGMPWGSEEISCNISEFGHVWSCFQGAWEGGRIC